MEKDIIIYPFFKYIRRESYLTQIIMKVSVYCLVYNHEKYIRSALNSFISQKTDFDYEVFVHDDASTDGSKKIIEEFVQKYPNIIKPIYQEENQYSKGVGIFSTFIFPKMSGDYVACCEGDDCWTDSLKLQRQVDFLDAHPDYVACVHNTIQKNMRTNKESVMYHHLKDDDISFCEAVQNGGCSYHTSSLMYRIEYGENRPDFFLKAKGFGDYPLAIFLTLSGKVRFLNYNMSLYRAGTENSWTKRNMQNIHNFAVSFQCVADMLEEVNKYTEYKYDEMIQKLILKNKYLNLYFDEKYNELRQEPYRQLFYNYSLVYRIKVYFKQYFNGAYHLYRKIIYKKGSK